MGEEERDTKKCAFCRELEMQKELFRRGFTAAERRDLLRQEYRVSLVVRTSRRGCGCTGTITHRARPLNFCPECGAALKRKRT